MEALKHSGEAVARHSSPDGKLTWRVQRDTNSDGSLEYTVGFEGLPWHLHADQLKRGGDPLAALLALTQELLTDQLVIMEVTWPVPDRPGAFDMQYCLLGDLETDIQTKPNDETWRLRFWSGRAVDIEDLIDGKVEFLPLDLRGPFE